MGLLEVANDLLGNMTFGEALTRLRAVYDELVLQGATDAAGYVMNVHNSIEAVVVLREEDAADILFGGPEGTYSTGQALTPEYRLEMESLSRWLVQNQLPGGDRLDPDAKPDAIDFVGVPAAIGGGTVVIVVVVWFLLRLLGR